MSSVLQLHSWVLDPPAAIRWQEELRRRLVLAWDGRPVKTVGGVDVHYSGDQARAAITVLCYPDLALLVTVVAEVLLTFPYIPGLLAFREGPAILVAWEGLPVKPDLLLFDGQGIAHPRRCGLASHLGLWLDIPSIGVAKSRLIGCNAEVGARFGDWSELRDDGDQTDVIGAALRTHQGSKPVFVSPGHRFDLAHALAFVLACCRDHRLPEPMRLAHQLSKGTYLPVEGA